MFAALCENPEYFKERMNLFVGIAPVVHVNNCASPLIQKYKDDKTLYKAFKLSGPEVLWKANSSDFVSGLITNSGVGTVVSAKIIAGISDSKPEMMANRGWKNYCKFYPSGTSF